MIKTLNTKKLVIVFDAQHARMFVAKGIKVIDEVQGVICNYKHKHKNNQKRQGFHAHLKTQNHFFDPHSEVRNIEHQEYVRYITHTLEEFLQEHSEYKQIIVAAEAKMLGEFRKYIKKNLHSKIIKEISHNLIHCERTEVEKIIFG
jgi:protein required for attachment to host cells